VVNRERRLSTLAKTLNIDLLKDGQDCLTTHRANRHIVIENRQKPATTIAVAMFSSVNSQSIDFTVINLTR
jgi:hypothetical protein